MLHGGIVCSRRKTTFCDIVGIEVASLIDKALSDVEEVADWRSWSSHVKRLKRRINRACMCVVSSVVLMI